MVGRPPKPFSSSFAVAGRSVQIAVDRVKGMSDDRHFRPAYDRFEWLAH